MNFLFNKKNKCHFFILSLLNNDRYSFIYKNLCLFPEIDLWQSINGYDKEETIGHLQKSGLKFISLDGIKSMRYGVLANFLTKYFMLKHQVDNDLDFMCMIEDDVALRSNFCEYINQKVTPLFKKNKKLNIVRLGVWGEIYVTSLASAKRTLACIEKEGIIDNIDNQLRKHSGPEKDLSKNAFKTIYDLFSETNTGDCLNTDFIDLSRVEETALKFSDIKPYCKYEEDGIMFFSQNGTDKYLIDNIFKRQKEGFFVDIGATNGINSNNTLTLDRFFDWSGFLIEPSMDFESLFVNRQKSTNIIRSKFISSSSGKSILFGHSTDSCFGSDSQILNDSEYNTDSFHPYNLTTVTFTDLFLENFSHSQVIDLFTLSCNGHESEVISGIDFNLIDIKVLFIKSNEKDELNKILNPHQFIFVRRVSGYFLYINALYLNSMSFNIQLLPTWNNFW